MKTASHCFYFVMATIVAFTLVVSLPAHADKKPRKNTYNSWRILDGNENQVGDFVSLQDLESAIVEIEIGGRPAFIRITPFYIWPDSELVYVTPDCTGQPYVRSMPGGTQDLWHTFDDLGYSYPVRIIDIFRNGETATPFLEIGRHENRNYYTAHSDGSCHGTSTANIRPVEQLDVDLHDRFPPPYSIEKRRSR